MDCGRRLVHAAAWGCGLAGKFGNLLLCPFDFKLRQLFRRKILGTDLPLVDADVILQQQVQQLLAVDEGNGGGAALERCLFDTLCEKRPVVMIVARTALNG